MRWLFCLHFQILNRTLCFKSSLVHVPKIKIGWFTISVRPIHTTNSKHASTRYVTVQEGIFKRAWNKIKYYTVEKTVSTVRLPMYIQLLAYFLDKNILWIPFNWFVCINHKVLNYEKPIILYYIVEAKYKQICTVSI